MLPPQPSPGPQPPAPALPPAAPIQQAAGAVGAPAAPAVSLPLPGPTASPGMPTGVPAPAAKPAMPPMPLPPIQRTLPPKEGPTAETATNPFERGAALLVDHAQDAAKRLSSNLNEVPPGSRELSADELKAMWYHSPVGSPPEADAKFWEIHDETLAATGDHEAAETKAMQATYPYRLILAQVGQSNAQRQVDLAEQLRKTIDGDQAPDSEQAGHDFAAHGTAIRHSIRSV